MSNQPLKTKELAALYRTTPKTINEWARAGLIPRIKVGERFVRFDLEAVQKAIAQRGGTDASHAG